MPTDGLSLDVVGRIVLSVLTVVFFALDAFATIAELSFGDASPTKLRYAASTPGGRQALRLLADKKRTISTMRVLSIISQAALSVMLFVLFISSLSPLWLGIVTAGLVDVLTIVVFGEILPSALGVRRPERMASSLAFPVRLFYFLFYPLTSLTGFFTWFTEKTLKVKSRPDMSEKDLQAVVTDVYDEGAIEKEEHDLIQNSLSFDDKTIGKIMTPMDKVVFADNGMTVAKIEHLFIENNYSRMPYLDRGTGAVLGILFQKDFYEMLLTGRKSVKSLVKPALFFSENINASVALKRLQRFRQHIAIVRDRSGNKAVGLLTVEDLVEEIVGEIEDEYDAEDIQKQQAQDMKKKSALAAKAEKKILGSDFEDTTVLPRNAPDYDDDDTSEDEDYNADRNDKGDD